MAEMTIDKITPTVAMVANKWYPFFKGPGRSYGVPFPTPQSILRGACGEENYKFEAKTVNTDYIRAACVMPRGLPYQHLMNVPWSMAYTTKEWVMIMVSVIDYYSWVDLAKSSGAIGYLIGHSKSHIYHWEPPRLDQHKLEVRPTNTLKWEGHRSDFDSQVKDYDKEAILDDLREGTMTHTEIGKKHGLSRITIQRISSRAGISMRKPHWGGVDVTA